jgi:hypothetical protein
VRRLNTETEPSHKVTPFFTKSEILEKAGKKRKKNANKMPHSTSLQGQGHKAHSSPVPFVKASGDTPETPTRKTLKNFYLFYY